MEYLHTKGPIYCRYASTPPIVNSQLAYQYGLESQAWSKSQYGPSFEEGRNVKLRIVFPDRSERMTCHATIDWVKVDPETNDYHVGLGRLSLSDDEFKVLLESSIEKPLANLMLSESVRQDADKTQPIVKNDNNRDIMRLKVINLPVDLIETIDEKRGEAAFSEYVTMSLRDYFTRIQTVPNDWETLHSVRYQSPDL